jgi:hypothetical protein
VSSNDKRGGGVTCMVALEAKVPPRRSAGQVEFAPEGFLPFTHEGGTRCGEFNWVSAIVRKQIYIGCKYATMRW